jgi:hypothetical protein
LINDSEDIKIIDFGQSESFDSLEQNLNVSEAEDDVAYS